MKRKEKEEPLKHCVRSTAADIKTWKPFVKNISCSNMKNWKPRVRSIAFI